MPFTISLCKTLVILDRTAAFERFRASCALGSETAKHTEVLCKHAATRCNTCRSGPHLSYGDCNALQHAATRCDTRRSGPYLRYGESVQHSATRCSTLQHAATRCDTRRSGPYLSYRERLQHAATRCNTLQHAATRVDQGLI